MAAQLAGLAHAKTILHASSPGQLTAQGPWVIAYGTVIVADTLNSASAAAPLLCLRLPGGWLNTLLGHAGGDRPSP